jgi:4-amino-4-deoxy-L-arabinose transferase-like glycosyltransferase
MRHLWFLQPCLFPNASERTGRVACRTEQRARITCYRRRALRWLWLLVVLIAMAIHLGGYPLFDADEGRNGEVGREMAVTNDYVMPRLDGLPYLDKPVIYFAAEAVAMEILGPTEVAARLPAFLFTLATAALVAWFARRLWGSDAAWVAAIALLTMPLALAFSRTVIFDSALSFFIVAAIIAFWFAIEERRRGATIVAWAAIGLGVLTKGPVAMALPLLVAIPYAIKRKNGRALFSIAGLIAFVIVIAPWVWAISRAIPDFLHYVLVTETAERLATGALKRTGPPWYFFPYLIGGAMPWSIVAIGGWRALRERWRDNDTFYLLLWIVVPFIFFSLSQSKRPQYILPLLPAIALLVARVLVVADGPSRTSGVQGEVRPGVPVQRWRNAIRTGAIAVAILGVVLVAATPFVHRHDAIIDAAIPTAIAIGGCAIMAGGVALFAKRRDIAIAALTLPVIALPLAANPLLKAMGAMRSEQSLVAQIRPYLTAETEVVGLAAYSGSLSFYLQRPIVVATPDAEELTSNYLIRHYDRFADNPFSTLRRLDWGLHLIDDRSRPRIFIVRDVDRAKRLLLEQHGARVIGTGPHFVAYTIQR